MAAQGTILVPFMPSIVETSFVAMIMPPAGLPTAKTFTSDHSSAMYLSKTVHMRLVESGPSSALPGSIASIVFGKSVGVEAAIPNVISATPFTARLYCWVGPAPSCPAAYTFNVNSPLEREVSSFSNQASAPVIVSWLGGTKVATLSSSPDTAFVEMLSDPARIAASLNLKFIVFSLS